MARTFGNWNQRYGTMPVTGTGLLQATMHERHPIYFQGICQPVRFGVAYRKITVP
jgi:hypothetical protein